MGFWNAQFVSQHSEFHVTKKPLVTFIRILEIPTFRMEHLENSTWDIVGRILNSHGQEFSKFFWPNMPLVLLFWVFFFFPSPSKTVVFFFWLRPFDLVYLLSLVHDYLTMTLHVMKCTIGWGPFMIAAQTIYFLYPKINRKGLGTMYIYNSYSQIEGR